MQYEYIYYIVCTTYVCIIIHTGKHSYVHIRHSFDFDFGFDLIRDHFALFHRWLSSILFLVLFSCIAFIQIVKVAISLNDVHTSCFFLFFLVVCAIYLLIVV